jgi:type VI secretion system protein ImpL
VFEAGPGGDLDKIAVPGFFTYDGFQRAFIDKLPTIADELQRDNWVLGDIGKLDAIKAQYDSLVRDLLERYNRDFVDLWTKTLAKLQIRPLNAGKPSYEALNAAAASTSPIRLLIESIRDESVLTRERKDPKAGSSDAKKEPAAAPVLGPQGSSPGADIEAQFKPFHQVVEGDGSRRMIDVILGDLTAINNSLQTIVLNPAQEQQAASALRSEVAQFKNDAQRMPSPFSRMLLRSADSFEDTIADDTYRQLSEALQNQVYGSCRSLTANRYPFVRGGQNEISKEDFGRLFGGNGAFDSFFRKLEPYADISRREWTWRKDNPVAQRMHDDTLRQFQRAALIKDVFFQTNGNVPSITLTVMPQTLAGTGLIAKLWVGGVPVMSSSQPGTLVPQQVQWPGAPGGKTDVTLEQDPPNPKVAPSEMLGNPRNTTSWALFRLLDKASKPPIANGISARWLFSTEVTFQILTGTSVNPFNPALFADFKCPTRL